MYFLLLFYCAAFVNNTFVPVWTTKSQVTYTAIMCDISVEF